MFRKGKRETLPITIPVADRPVLLDPVRCDAS
jgi:hypothetical protein